MAYGYGGLALTVDKPVLAGAAGGVLGVAQAITLAQLDSMGQLGASPLPQLGAFGTPGGLINTTTGAIATIIGVMGIMGHGPTARHPSASAFATTYGLSTLIAQVIQAAFGSAATTTPAVMAARRGRAAPSITTNARPFRGAVLPYGRTVGV
ncbi:MAG TPA: hypothetical protein VMG99_08755 [Thermoplasmata archaeon]|nr:hypothetical protein [Thermoplasmata archaeon]